MAHFGPEPHRSGKIAAAMGRAGPESIAQTRASLIEKGLLYSVSLGLNLFTVPQFDTYIRRTFRIDEVPPETREG